MLKALFSGVSSPQDENVKKAKLLPTPAAIADKILRGTKAGLWNVSLNPCTVHYIQSLLLHQVFHMHFKILL